MNPTQKRLQAALELLGPNGERWTKGAYSNESGHCAIGALRMARQQDQDYGYDPYNPRRADAEALDLAARELGVIPTQWDTTTGRLAMRFNDNLWTTFDEIRDLFERAIRIAGERG